MFKKGQYHLLYRIVRIKRKWIKCSPMPGVKDQWMLALSPMPHEPSTSGRSAHKEQIWVHRPGLPTAPLFKGQQERRESILMPHWVEVVKQ